MSEENWVNPEILDNPTGEVVIEDPVDPDAEAPVEVAESEEADPVAATEREKAGILKELTETRKEMKRERLENAERNRVLEERLGKLFEAKEAAVPQPVAPDPEDDPLGSISFQQQQLAAQQQEMLQQSQMQQQQTVQQQQLQQAAQEIRKQEVSFQKTAEIDEDTYEGALAHARAEVKNYYTAMGYPDDQAEQYAQIEQVQFAAAAVQRGVNPAEARYNLAVSRGYQPPAAEEPAAETPAIPQTLEFKKAAVGESKSLGTAGGSPGKHRITLEDLANADTEVFDRITKDPALWEELNVKGSLVL